MNLAKWILDRSGWKFACNIPPTAKCVICVAPHTSNWDFVLGELATRSVGMKASFLMKSTWFFFPMGYVMRALGGIPVNRSHSTHVADSVVAEFNRRDRLWVAVTPEGPTGDIDADMMAIKRYYQGKTGRHPEQFDTGL